MVQVELAGIAEAVAVVVAALDSLSITADALDIVGTVAIGDNTGIVGVSSFATRLLRTSLAY